MINTGLLLFFLFNDTATTEIYTLSLHDALPIFFLHMISPYVAIWLIALCFGVIMLFNLDRKSTRLNSSHLGISYAAFCLKKKNDAQTTFPTDGDTPAVTTAQAVLYQKIAQLYAADRQAKIEAENARIRRFFFNDTATTEIYTLSLHDALPI